MIGIICAMQIEAEGILSLAENKETEVISEMKFTTGTLFGKDIVLVVCGEGKVNAAMCAAVLILKYEPECVINCGVAGSLSEKVSIGDIVIADKSVQHDMNMKALGYEQGEVCLPDGKTTYFECDSKVQSLLLKVSESLEDTRVEVGTVASGDIFVSDRKLRVKIGNEFGALACEMEGASIGQVCFRFETPYGILRAISDDLDENKGMDFVKFCELACKKTVGIVSDFVKEY